MGRNNADFQKQALYHGSYHPFEPGDMIVPNSSDHEEAFASPNLDYVQWHVHLPDSSAGVYEVEGTGDEVTHPNYKDVKMSKTGFKVVRKLDKSELPPINRDNVFNYGNSDNEYNKGNG